MNKENLTFRIRNERIKELSKRNSGIGGAAAVAFSTGAAVGVFVGRFGGVPAGIIAGGLVGITCYATTKVIEYKRFYWNKEDTKKMKVN